MADNANIEARLERLRGQEERVSWPRKLALPAAMLVIGAAGGAWIALVEPARKGPVSTMPTSEVTEFQSDAGLSGFTITETMPQPAPLVVAGRDGSELDEARAALAAVQAELAAARAAGEDSAALDELRAEIQQMREDNARLQADLDAAQLMAGEDRDRAMREAEEMAELARRRAEQEALRAQMEAELASRARSPMVAYRASGGGSQMFDEGLDDPENRHDAAERFRRGAADKADSIRAEVIGDPSRTVVQGTLIEATLSTAISSQLEGNVTATVSYDVWSMDMANVVIPRGSKLFGRYSSGIEKGQRRILVAWDRVVTPDGQSAVLAAYGADRVGRSGVTGRVDTHALSRFGAAAAISVIGAIPVAIAAAAERGEDRDVTRDTAVRVGTDASNVIGGIMKDYIDIPTTIHVDQGAVVMVVVNADLEML